jgi:hypothetical protein
MLRRNVADGVHLLENVYTNCSSCAATIAERAREAGRS